MTSRASDEDTFVAWADNALLLLGGFILICFLLIQTITVRTQEKPQDIASPGSIVVTISWPDEINADVDLWVEAPGDVSVGYSRKAGHIFNLLRDDLGTTSDISSQNYENAYTRGLPAGEYIVNVHMYHVAEDRLLPIPVEVVVEMRPGDTGMRAIGKAIVMLTRTGEEITAIRFTLNSKHELIPGSINHVQRELRNS